MIARHRASIGNWIDQTERRTWFLFESPVTGQVPTPDTGRFYFGKAIEDEAVAYDYLPQWAQRFRSALGN
jgi:hypothetical protein